MKKIYKETFEKIHLDKKVDEIILDKTIYSSHKKMTKKFAIIFSAFLLVLIAGVGVVYAEKIVTKIKNLFETTTINFEDSGFSIYLDELKFSNKKELNFDAEFLNLEFPILDNQQKIMFNELKENLNISVLTPYILEDNVARIIKLEKNNNKISHGCFVLDDVYVFKKDSKTAKISMSIEFITKYYEEDYFKMALGQSFNENKVYKSIEFNEKLNVDVYFWGAKAITNDDENIGTLKAIFEYDDIIYEITGTNLSKNDMLNFLNTLEYI